MEKFMELLNNDKVVLRIDMFTEDETIFLTGITFNIDDYSVAKDYIKLIDDSGLELVLPNEVNHVEDEDEFGTWIFKKGNTEIYIYVIEIN